MKDKPTISVLMPVYNIELYLAEAIESVLSQTEACLELIIVDDASTDSTLAIARRYAEQDERIVIIERKKNSGIGACRNAAIDIAQGEYLAIMDGDDICQPNRFEEQLRWMKEHQLDICGSAIRYFGTKDNIKYYPSDDKIIKLNLFSDVSSLATPTVMFRKDRLGSVRYNPALRFAEDVAFYIALALQEGLTFGNCPKVLLNYRLHAQQTSQVFIEKKNDFFTNVFFDLIAHSYKSLTREVLNKHLQLIKKRRVLVDDDFPVYPDYLLALSAMVKLKGAERDAYWYRFCKKQYIKTRSVANLYRELTGRKKNFRYFSLYIIGLLNEMISGARVGIR